MTGKAEPNSGLFGGRYAIGSVIGVGASASVYEADEIGAAPGEDRRIALKILHPHLADRPEVRAAFLREGARARGLRHPNIVAVHGCGLHDAGGVTLAWIALDLVEGVSLADWINQHGRMTVPEAVAVASGTLAALRAAHQLGIVHRDVTPRNIMLARSQADQAIAAFQVRVLDFGLADAAGGTTVGSDVLLAGDNGGEATVVGSAHYMSPEQAQGRPITAAGDLYQAGAVLYFLLTAQPPYPRDTLEQVLAAQVSAPPPVPSALVPSASPLDRVVTKALAKDPARRYADAYAFGEALRGSLASLALSGHGYQPTLVMAAASPSRSSTLPATASGAAPTLPARPSGAGEVRAGGLSTSPARPAGTSTAAAVRSASRPPLPPAPEPERSPAVGLAIAGIAAVAVLAVGSAVVGNQPATAPLPSPAPLVSAIPSLTPTPTPSPSNPVLVTVPMLYGTLTDAENELTSLGLRLGRVSRVDSAEAADQILEQSPDRGLQVAWGTVVKVKVASGFNTVPTVADLSFDRAVSALKAAGFTCLDAQQPFATIVGTTPAVGTRARLGTPIALAWDSPASVSPSPSPDSASPLPSSGG